MDQLWGCDGKSKVKTLKVGAETAIVEKERLGPSSMVFMDTVPFEMRGKFRQCRVITPHSCFQKRKEIRCIYAE